MQAEQDLAAARVQAEELQAHADGLAAKCKEVEAAAALAAAAAQTEKAALEKRLSELQVGAG